MKRNKLIIASFLFVIIFLLTVQSFNAADANKSTDTVKKDYKTQSAMKSQEKINKVNIDKKDYKKSINTTKKQNTIKSINKTDTTKNNKEVIKSYIATNKTEQKQITKNNIKNTKKATERDVSSYSELHEALTNPNDEEITINLVGNDEDYIIDSSTGQITASNQITKLTINGNSHIIDGDSTYGFLKVETMNLTINNIIVKNCKVNDYGSAIYVTTTNSNVTIKDSKFENNEASYGGIISSDKGVTININNCNFTKNKGVKGGALHFNNSKVNITKSVFTENVNKGSNQHGGAVYLSKSITSISETNFTKNIAYDAAGVYSEEGKLNVTGCNFDLNAVYDSSEGGGIALRSWTNTLYLNNTNFTNNRYGGTGEFGGGAVSLVYNSNNLIENCYMNNNSAKTGGAIHIDNSTLKLKDTVISNNTAIYGGGLMTFVQISANHNYVNVSNVTFINNTATQYGGAIDARYVTMNVVNSTFEKNKSNKGIANLIFNYLSSTIVNIEYSVINDTGGRVFYNYDGATLNLNYNNISNNTCVRLFENHATLNMNYNNITNNTATQIFYLNGTSTLSHNTIKNNQGTQILILNYKKAILSYNNITNNSESQYLMVNYDNETISYNNITNNSATYMIIYNIFNTTLSRNDIINNSVTSSYTIIFNNANAIINIDDNLFVNNTDNTRDMLLNNNTGRTFNVANNNKYIDNFLEDYISSIDSITISDNKDKAMLVNVNLRKVYNNVIVNGTIILYDENKNELYTSNVTNGIALLIIPVDKLSVGLNNLNLSYKSLSKHYQDTSIKLEVTRTVEPVIVVEDNYVTDINKSVEIVGHAYNQIGELITVGTVNLTINDETFETTFENGEFNLSYTSSVAGKFNVTAKYYRNPTDTEPSIISEQKTLTVNKLSTFTKVTVLNNTVDNVTMEVKVVNGSNIFIKQGVLNITVEGHEYQYSYDVFGDKIIIKLSDIDAFKKYLTTGDVEVTVAFNESDVYKSSQGVDKDGKIFKNITIIPKTTNVTIEISPSSVELGNTVTIQGTLYDSSTKEVIPNTILTIRIDEHYIDDNVKVDSNGKYKYTYNSTSTGEHKVRVIYTSDDTRYDSSTNISSFVTKENSQMSTIITVKASSTKAGSNTIISGKLVDEKNNGVSGAKISIVVNNNDEYIVTTDSDGSYSKSVPASITGVNNVTVTYPGDKNHKSSTDKTTFNVENLSTKLTVNKINDTAIGGKAKVTGKLSDENGKAVSNATIKVTVNGKTYTTKTGSDGSFSVSALTNSTGKLKVKVEYSGSEKYSSSSTTTSVTVNKNDVILEVKSVTGVIGENMTFTATVTDKKGNNINGGNIIFKLNGVSFNSNKRFDNSSSTPYKFTVKNGKVSFKIIADYYLKNGGNITATYSGTDTYKNVTSKVAKLTVKLRNMKITVKAEPSRVKQYKNVTFTATVTDTTKNAKNKTALLENSYVLFKINGKTIKVKGKTANVTVKSNKVTYKYTIPAGTAGIYVNKKIRFYNVTALYGSKLFNMKNNSAKTNYTVARSKITITVNKAVIKNKKLSIKGTIKDYMKKYVKGTNKVCIKIDGHSYEVNGKVKYFFIKKGRINLKNIKITNPSSVKKLVIVSGERVAYLKGQSKAKKIVKI